MKDKNKNIIVPGQYATWYSEAQGYGKHKEGTILALLLINSDLYKILNSFGLQNVPKSRIKGQNSSVQNRILVEVKRKSGNGADYYTPRPGQVEVI